MTTESNIASIEGLSIKRALNLAALPLLSYSEKNIKFFIDMPIVSMPPDAYLSFLPVKTQNFLMAKTHFNIFCWIMGHSMQLCEMLSLRSILMRWNQSRFNFI